MLTLCHTYLGHLKTIKSYRYTTKTPSLLLFCSLLPQDNHYHDIGMCSSAQVFIHTICVFCMIFVVVKHTIKFTTLTILKCKIQCQYIHNVMQPSPLTSSRTFLSPQKEAPPLWAVTPSSSLPLATTKLIYISTDWFILNFLFIFSLLLLLSLHRIMVVGESKIYRRENDRREVVFVLSFLLLLKWSSWRQSDRYGSHRR